MKKKLMMIVAFLSCAGLNYGDHKHHWQASDADDIITHFGWHTQADMSQVDHKVGNKRFVEDAYDAVLAKLPPLNYSSSGQDIDALFTNGRWKDVANIPKVNTVFNYRVMTSDARVALINKYFTWKASDADNLIKAHPEWKTQIDIPTGGYKTISLGGYRGFQSVPNYTAVVDGKILNKDAYLALSKKLPPLEWARSDARKLINGHPNWETKGIPPVNSIIDGKKFVSDARYAVVQKIGWSSV